MNFVSYFYYTQSKDCMKSWPSKNEKSVKILIYVSIYACKNLENVEKRLSKNKVWPKSRIYVTSYVHLCSYYSQQWTKILKLENSLSRYAHNIIFHCTANQWLKSWWSKFFITIFMVYLTNRNEGIICF